MRLADSPNEKKYRQVRRARLIQLMLVASTLAAILLEIVRNSHMTQLSNHEHAEDFWYPQKSAMGNHTKNRFWENLQEM